MTIKLLPKSDEKPVARIEDKNINAIYYHDGSGEIALLRGSEEFFFCDNGKLNHHIKDIELSIKYWKSQIEIAERTLPLMRAAQEHIKKLKKSK